jgi:hypothetical protein
MITSSHVGALAVAQGDVARIFRRAADEGAPWLTVASPVDMPTFSGPKSRHRARNFSLTRP